ncbi:MAG: transglycosylase domain-containing protein [Hyphomicrobiales bacterium]|nr:transglycosylase domain-containing protein [Hyphomicrobiales bacterium]
MSRLRKSVARAMLAFDAWVDSSLYDAGRISLRILQAIAAMSERLHVAGLRKLAFDLACEGCNVAVVGLIVVLIFAQPAFRQTSDEDWLKRADLAVTFLDRYGVEVGRRGIKHDDAIPFDELPDHFIKAVLATEDRRFFDHFGIDVIGTLRAVTVNAHAGGVVQGGSSITQQLAKNLFLSNERSISRKINEAYLALWLEHHLTKKQILSLYLDRAYMGGGTFGVQAAAQYYFGKSARDINLAEAAMLAGLFKAPTKYSPNVDLPAARARANDVLSNLVDAGFMTEGQVYAARRNPATPVSQTGRSSPDWYLDFAYDEVKALANSGKLGAERVLVVRTGLDGNLQTKSESVIEDMLRVHAPAFNAHQAAAVIADPDGLVRAMVGGRDYGASQFNRATEALRQPGSSFKIFVYLAALLTGKFHSNTIIDASSVCIGDYCVHNFEGESAGRLTLTQALAQSLNTAAVRLSIKIGEAYWPANQPYHLGKIAALGRAKIVETARAMGLTTPLADTVSLPVGADEVKMIDMVGANATLANGGRRATAHAVVEVRNSTGAVIYTHAANGPSPIQVIPADKVAEMNAIMTHVVTEGTGRAAQIPGLVISGKTGTTNNSTNAWFNGFTGNFVGSVWFGNDDNSPAGKMTGGTLPAETWHDIMAYAHEGVEAKPPFGVAPAAPAGQIAAASAANKGGAGIVEAPRQIGLSPHSAKIILEIGDIARTAQKRAAAEPSSDYASEAGSQISVVRGGVLSP